MTKALHGNNPENRNRPMDKPTFGQVCTVCAIAQKIRYVKDKDILHTHYERKLIAPKNGIYIGYRNVHNGYTETVNEYGERGNVLSAHRKFTNEYSHQVWVFVFNEKEKTVYVFPEDVRIL